MPANGTLKPRSRATMAPPMKLPNIGIKQNTPVIRPNGKASPGEILKQRQIMKTETAVQPALISATVTALDTYVDTVLASRFMTRLFKVAKSKGINTCLDTSGNPFTREEPFFSKFNELMGLTDLFILDIKQIDLGKHKELTGFTNENILDLASYLSDNGKPMWIRHVLVPGITTDEGDLTKLAEFIKTLKTVERTEVLPYHTLGVAQYNKMGIPYALDGVTPPSKEEIAKAKEILGITK